MLSNTLRLNFCYFKIIQNHLKIIGHILKISKIISVGSSRLWVFCREVVLRNFTKFTRKIKCEGLFFNKIAGSRPPTLLKKETLAQMFSCEFCEIYKNTYFYRTPPVVASEVCLYSWDYRINYNENEDENGKRSHKYYIIRPRSVHGHKFSNYKKCLGMMMLICIKQHLSKICSSIHEKVISNT